jgi:hypothetical protein
MILTHAEWLAGVVVLGSSLLFAVTRAVRQHVAQRVPGQS